jgi:hypothetical protein
MLRPCLTAVLVVAIGCVQPEELVRPDLAKSSSGPTVTATDPPFGRRGDQGAQITITGTGFDNGSRASWERNGSTDPKVNVRSTTFVSSTQLVATVDIATDASLSLYDVAVTTTTGRKGIGTAKFEVTQAEPIAGTESAFGVNENGEVAGRIGPPGAFYWSPGSGLLALGTPGRAYDLSEDGQTVAGFTGVCCDGAFVQEYDGAAWQYTRLPRDPAASYHAARAVGSDPTTGAAVYVGGLEGYPGKGNTTIRQPRLWSWDGSVWTRGVLPAPSNSDSPLFDVNASGAAAGAVGGKASAWLPNGAGSWSLATFGAAGSQGWAINAAGTIVVGYAASGGATVAQYWTLSGTTWSAHSLPGGCSEAVDIDAAGRILANGCANGNRRTPAVISPPYATSDVRLLGALGYSTGTTTASRLSAQGTWAVGQAPYKSGSVGVRWSVGVP